MASQVSRGLIDFDSPTVVWPCAREQMKGVMKWVAQPWSMVEIPDRVVAIGVSDAAGREAGGFRAAIVRIKEEVLVWRFGRVEDRIEVAEFDAAAEPVMKLIDCGDIGAGIIDWQCDNTVAVSWLSRTWATDWKRNEILMQMRGSERLHRKMLRVSSVRSAENRADVLTRCRSRDSNHICPGCFAWRQRMECACEKICDHVSAWIHGRLRDMGCI
jgi:hypothetical protein